MSALRTSSSARVLRRASMLLCALGALAACGGSGGGGDDDDDSSPLGSLPSDEGVLLTTNSAGRTGAYYLPSRPAGTPIPLVLAYHPTGGDGSSFLSVFRDLAESETFVIVAPDSRVAPDGELTWEVGDSAGEITEDVTHALACIDEVEERLELAVDENRLLAMGHSGGGSSAPYIASNHERFTAFAVLHGGIFPGGIGSHIVPGWFSTGEDDTLRPPAHIQAAADTMTALGFDDLTVQLYPGGHSISEDEATGLVGWWLGD